LNARLAHWFDNLADTEVELHVITLGHNQDTGQFVAQSSGDPILARPFFDLEAGVESSSLIAYPGLAFPNASFPLLELDSGRIEIRSSSDFHSAGALFRHTWRQSNSLAINLLAGYRYLRYEESLRISESQVYRDPSQTEVGTIDSFDSFDTRNVFHGGEVGADLSLYHSRATLLMLGKVAIGNVREVLDIAGETQITTPDPAQDQTSIGGLLTAPSNIGRHSDNRFGLVPELAFTLHAPLTRSLVVHAGYTVIVFPQVLRTGSQIDTSIDRPQTVDSQRPRAKMDESTLWIHGIHVGVEF
jgi:hypothetical protein